MTPNFRQISPEHFKTHHVKDQLGILFDYINDLSTSMINMGDELKSINGMLSERQLNCEKRFLNVDNRLIKLNRRTFKDNAIAAGSGIFGGFMTMLAKLTMFDK